MTLKLVLVSVLGVGVSVGVYPEPETPCLVSTRVVLTLVLTQHLVFVNGVDLKPKTPSAVQHQC